MKERGGKGRLKKRREAGWGAFRHVTSFTQHNNTAVLTERLSSFLQLGKLRLWDMKRSGQGHRRGNDSADLIPVGLHTNGENPGFPLQGNCWFYLISHLHSSNLPDYTPSNPPHSSKMCHKSQALPEVHSAEALLEFSFHPHCIRLQTSLNRFLCCLPSLMSLLKRKGPLSQVFGHRHTTPGTGQDHERHQEAARELPEGCL